MTTHNLKTWPVVYQAVVDGLKPFEIRHNDRNFQVGDTLVLQEWDVTRYTGREHRVVVTYMLPLDMFGAPGKVAMTIKPEAP